MPEGYSCCDCDTVEVSGRYIALCHKISGGVTIYNQADLSLVGQISDLELRQGSEGNPPADLLFISNEELFVGTWERLFLYRMIPEKPDCKPAQRCDLEKCWGQACHLTRSHKKELNIEKNR